jgi:hypothetical protein
MSLQNTFDCRHSWAPLKMDCQFAHELVFPKYEQNEWVQSQNFNSNGGRPSHLKRLVWWPAALSLGR